MRTLGINEIEDIALGASLLGAGGGGDPYIGKLMAMDAIKTCGDVTMLDPEEIADDDLVIPIAMMGAPTVLAEKGINGSEYKRLYDMVSQFYGREIKGFFPIEAGGVNSMLPIAASARLGIPLVDVDGMGRAFPELQMVTFTLGGVSATPMALTDEKGNTCIFETITNKWTEDLARAVTMTCGGSVCIALYGMDGATMKNGESKISSPAPRSWALLSGALNSLIKAKHPKQAFLRRPAGIKSSKAKLPMCCVKPPALLTWDMLCWTAFLNTGDSRPR